MTDEPQWEFDGHGRLIDLGARKMVECYGPPEATTWVSVDDLPSVLGLAVADSGPFDTQYDLRACSEVYEQAGSRWVNLVHQAQWWAWLALSEDQRSERCPRSMARRSMHVWAEVRHPAKTRRDPHA